MSTDVHAQVVIAHAHSKLGASSMYRWGTCPGSVRQSAGIKGFESAFAKEGTLAHEIAAAILEKGISCREAALCDPEMLENIMVYVDYINGLIREHRDAQVFIEKRLDLEKIYPGCFGTGDAILYVPSTKTLYVNDLKYGAGIAVNVREDGKPNTQLMYYGLGALLELNVPVEKVVITVIQPRCFHADGPIRSLVVGALEVLDFADELVTLAKRTEEPNAPLVPGKHCRFCPALPQCPETKKQAHEVAKGVFDEVGQISISVEKLEASLTLLPQLESWIKSVRELAYAEAMAGRTPAGWKLVEKRASRKWIRDEGQTSDVLSTVFGLSDDQIFEKSLRSAPQIEKLLSKTDKKKLGSLYASVSSGLTLVEESDPRTPATNVSAAESFTAIENQEN